MESERGERCRKGKRKNRGRERHPPVRKGDSGNGKFEIA